MTRKTTLALALAAILAAGAGTGAAFAKDNRDGDLNAASLANVKVTLQQAIATAEQQENGRAISAGIEQHGGAARIEVEVMGAQGVKTVMVDPQSGQVTATQADNQDHEDND